MTLQGGIDVPHYEEQAVREPDPLGGRQTVTPDGSATLRVVDPAPAGGEERLRSLVWREALHRRLLALGDVAAASIALVVLLNVFGQRRVAALALVGIALLLFLFKVTGLYDRDDLRLVHSTLDEVPALAQLTGLFALGVAILQSIVLVGGLSAERIAALWIASFCTIVCGRILARAVAGRTSPVERCLVIGEVGQADRIRDKLASSRARAEVIASLPLASEDDTALGEFGNTVIMRRVVNDLGVHRIIIAPTTTDTKDVVDLIRVAKAAGVRVSVLPRMFEVVGSAVEFDDVDGMTMLGVREIWLLALVTGSEAHL